MNNRRPRALHTILTLLLLMIVLAPAYAQNDTKGREFWVTFLANWGSGANNETSDLRLYISSDRPTKVGVVYGEQPRDTFQVSVDQPFTTYTVDINEIFGEYTELVGGVRYSNQSFHVIAQDDITLYGVNIRSKSADAFLALPEDVLGGTYIVLAYPNGFDESIVSYDMPSQFAIVATQDGTTMRITPSPGTTLNETESAPFTVNLDRGEVYFAQADIGPWKDQDVSGTEISANKPIAVFAGNRRTSIPTSVGNFRDHLVEQMPPLEVWGREAILTPHFPITPASTAIYPAVARILPAFEGTEWSIDGVSQGMLTRGVSQEIELTRAMHISATGPILVAQYEHSVGGVGGGSGGEFGLGDPFMMLIPPSEQFDTAYSFQSVQHPEFRRHFINVVVPTAAIPSVMLDGQPLNLRGLAFKAVPGTVFSFVQVEVTPGSHYIRAAGAFGLYVYGFGAANSYGYTGGMLFRKLVTDFQAPELFTDVLCGTIKGFVFDTRISDTGIDSFYVYDSVNVRVAIDSFASPADTINFRIELIDPYQDGIASVVAIDSVGRVMREDFRIPGFTLRTTLMTSNQPSRYDTLVAFNDKEFCRTILIENYGEFPQTVNKIEIESVLGEGVTHNAPLPMTLAPGERKEVSICTYGQLDTTVDARITLNGDCAGRDVAIVPILRRIDSIPPGFDRPIMPCGDDLTVSFTESDGSGIERIIVNETINCVASYSPGAESFPTRNLQLSLHRVDPRYDMIYHVTLVDRAGNTRVVHDTIGGFTVAAVDFAGDTVGISRARALVSDTLGMFKNRCDSIILTNYGSQPLPITQITMRGNVAYSIPPAQLPLVIPPYGRVTVALCLEGRVFGDQIDTVVIANQCGLVEEVAVKAQVNLMQGIGADICNNALHVEQHAPSKRTFLQTPVPNPAAGPIATIDVGMAIDDNVALELFTADGQPALTIMRGIELGAGISRVTFDISTLDAGVYFCRLATVKGGTFVQKMVIAR